VSRYAIVGGTSGELLTYRGRAIVHDDKSEMEYLLPNSRIIRVTDGDLGQPVMQLRDHPDMASVKWPLDRADFVT
jgi:hypothetical protein